MQITTFYARKLIALDGCKLSLISDDGEVLGVISVPPGIVRLDDFDGLRAYGTVEVERGVVVGPHGSRVSDFSSDLSGETAAAQDFVPSAAYQQRRMVEDVAARVLQIQRVNEERRALRASRAHKKETDDGQAVFVLGQEKAAEAVEVGHEAASEGAAEASEGQAGEVNP